MAVFAAAGGHRRKQRMAHATKYPLALAAVVHGVFPKDFGQGVARGGGDGGDAKIGTESFGVGFGTLAPLRRRIFCLIDAGNEGGPEDWIRAERFEQVGRKLGLL